MTVCTFSALEEGQVSRWRHQISEQDIDDFVALSGDDNPVHTDDDYARSQGFRARLVHGALLGGYVSGLLQTLGGPGILCLSQSLQFVAPAYAGDTIEVTVRVKHKSPSLRLLVLESRITNEREELLMTGEARTKILAQVTEVP